MKKNIEILATADLHYGLHEDGDLCTMKLAGEVCRSKADAFILAGDTFGVSTVLLEKCLAMFKDFRGKKLLIPGNHDLWCISGTSTWLYESVIPRIAKKYGFVYLEKEPVVIGKTGFVGSVGWYDYSFFDKNSKIPMEFIREKEYPGVASWNDGRFINWEFNDEEFTNKVLDKLYKDIKKIYLKTDQIVAITHFAPFEEIIATRNGLIGEFGRAFLGSRSLGELFLDFEKIKYTICGHTHSHHIDRIESLQAINVGSTYHKKRLIRVADDVTCMTFSPDSDSEPEPTCPIHENRMIHENRIISENRIDQASCLTGGHVRQDA